MKFEDKTNISSPKWYRQPIIHFPLWLIFIILYTIRFDKLLEYENISTMESIIICGFIILVTALWGWAGNMFLVRIPILSKFIYDNDYVRIANGILMFIGTTILIFGVIFLEKDILDLLFF